MNKLLNFTIFGNSVLQYAVSIFIFLFFVLVVKIFALYVIKIIKRFAEKTKNKFDDFLVNLLNKIAIPALYLVGLYLATKSLNIPLFLKKFLNYTILAVVIFFGIKIITAFINFCFKVYLIKQKEDPTLEKSLAGILIIIRVVLWIIALMFFLDNLGFKISTIIAGLGIGGVAIALAAQTILKDLFSYFCIIFDKPFRVGDFIVVGDFSGNVEYIGIKTTRLRSINGEVLIISNSDLTDSRIRNYKLMERRRVIFKIGVVYNTDLEKIKEIPRIIEKIISNINDAIFDRAHFSSFGDFSLLFEVSYFVLGSDYKKYMDVQEKINIAIMEEFKKHNIEFAYPTQTIFLNKL